MLLSNPAQSCPRHKCCKRCQPHSPASPACIPGFLSHITLAARELTGFYVMLHAQLLGRIPGHLSQALAIHQRPSEAALVCAWTSSGAASTCTARCLCLHDTNQGFFTQSPIKWSCPGTSWEVKMPSGNPHS